MTQKKNRGCLEEENSPANIAIFQEFNGIWGGWWDMIKFTHIFPLFRFGCWLTYEMCESCCCFCPVGGVQCEQVLVQLSVQYPRGDRYKLRRLQRRGGQTGSLCQSVKALIQNLFFYLIFLGCVGCGVQLKNTSGKKVQTCELLDVRWFFWPGATPPPQYFYDPYVCLGGQPSNLTVAYFFPMVLVQPPTAISIEAPYAATLRSVWPEAI